MAAAAAIGLEGLRQANQVPEDHGVFPGVGDDSQSYSDNEPSCQRSTFEAVTEEE